MRHLAHKEIKLLLMLSLLLLSQHTINAAQKNDDIKIIDNPFVLIIDGPKRVLKEINPDAPILGIANRGKYYPLISKGEAWAKINFNGKIGFIENVYVEVVDKKSSTLLIRDLIFFLIITISIILLFIILKLYFRRDEVKSEWFQTVHIPKKILLISNATTLVKSYLTNDITPLKTSFTELGFSVKTATNFTDANKLIFNFMPDAIAIDWNIEKDALTTMELMHSSKSTITNIFVIFYNVPESFNPETDNKIPNAQFLNLSFSDKDLFNIITPLIITGENQQEITKSVETAALQGPVQNGSISDVLQFIEIGRKTGCLLIEEQKPTGIVYFKDGTINYAVSRQNRAENAIYDILSLNSGRFSFVLDRQPKTPNCSISILGVLMQWAKENDEASGDRLR